jgi:ABC-type glycerol-3-phosphate transport system substrate-binding protein
VNLDRGLKWFILRDMKRYIVTLLLLLVLLPACSLLKGGEPEGTGTPEAAGATPGATPTLAARVTPAATAVAVPQQQAPMRIWLVQELSPATNVPGGTVLAGQLAAYELNHPDVKIEVEVKTVEGRGGIISYLRSGKSVAPGVLPDLIGLPVEQLTVAASEGLIMPLTSVVDQSDQQDLFPAALSLGQVNGQLYGYPIALKNLTHMVYSSDVFTQTVPATWNRLISADQAHFAFPGAGRAGAELLLQLYLADGGTLVDESSRPALQLDVLTKALRRFGDGRASGVIPLETSSFTNYGESWSALGSVANSVETVAAQFLVQQAQSTGEEFAELPGPNAPLTPLVDGWAWAVSASDPVRQATAADILNWLAAGPNMGDWTMAATSLPARRSAFEQWSGDQPYLTFLQKELERAVPYPMMARGAVLDQLGIALYDVLSLSSSPETAAQAAVSALRQ